MDFAEDDLPITRIPFGVHFVDKKEEPLMQLADACAFTIRRFLQKELGSVELMDALKGSRSVVSGMRCSEGGKGMIRFE
jgi:hypothetical protein